MPSWNSNRIFDRPRNGREISSSMFGLTRRTRLYVLNARKKLSKELVVMSHWQPSFGRGYRNFTAILWKHSSMHWLWSRVPRSSFTICQITGFIVLQPQNINMTWLVSESCATALISLYSFLVSIQIPIHLVINLANASQATKHPQGLFEDQQVILKRVLSLWVSQKLRVISSHQSVWWSLQVCANHVTRALTWHLWYSHSWRHFFRV